MSNKKLPFDLSSVLSIIALTVSVFTVIYLAKGFHFSKGLMTSELHKYFLEKDIFIFDDDFSVRFDFDLSFYKKNKSDIDRYFSSATYKLTDSGVAIDATEAESEVRDKFYKLSVAYSGSIKALEIRDGSQTNLLLRISFYNKLGSLLENDLLDNKLAKQLFEKDFRTFFHFYFVKGDVGSKTTSRTSKQIFF